MTNRQQNITETQHCILRLKWLHEHNRPLLCPHIPCNYKLIKLSSDIPASLSFSPLVLYRLLESPLHHTECCLTCSAKDDGTADWCWHLQKCRECLICASRLLICNFSLSVTVPEWERRMGPIHDTFVRFRMWKVLSVRNKDGSLRFASYF